MSSHVLYKGRIKYEFTVFDTIVGIKQWEIGVICDNLVNSFQFGINMARDRYVELVDDGYIVK